jgi:hypothetical protein
VRDKRERERVCERDRRKKRAGKKREEKEMKGFGPVGGFRRSEKIEFCLLPEAAGAQHFKKKNRRGWVIDEEDIAVGIPWEGGGE